MKLCEEEGCDIPVEGRYRFCDACSTTRFRTGTKLHNALVKGHGWKNNSKIDERILKANKLKELSYALPWEDGSGYF